MRTLLGDDAAGGAAHIARTQAADLTDPPSLHFYLKFSVAPYKWQFVLNIKFNHLQVSRNSSLYSVPDLISRHGIFLVVYYTGSARREG